jgi:cytochrome P450
MFGAGSDTTASAISVGVMASACYPEAAERVRKELDSVIGKERREYFLGYFFFFTLIKF